MDEATVKDLIYVNEIYAVETPSFSNRVSSHIKTWKEKLIRLVSAFISIGIWPAQIYSSIVFSIRKRPIDLQFNKQ